MFLERKNEIRYREALVQWIGPRLFFFGLFCGILFFFGLRGDFSEAGGFFSRTQLRERSGLTYEPGTAYFLYLCMGRVLLLVIVFLLSVTCLGKGFLAILIFGGGFSGGMLVTAAVLRYGIRGGILVLAGLFPQYLFYVPVFWIAIHLCRERRYLNLRFFLQCLVLSIVVIIGCFFECYVNYGIITKLLKYF